MGLDSEGAIAFIDDMVSPFSTHAKAFRRMALSLFAKPVLGTLLGIGFKGGFGLEGLSTLLGVDDMALPPIDLAVFHDNGFVRKQCRVTDLWFWTSDPKRETCGDTAEDEYTFIGAPLIAGFEQRGKPSRMR